MLNGERRWASARRGGMTVLGKVAVPKPINLPSQRLENHGLDPKVEIVPKGTLSWGSRPSSSTSNAWGSSSLSPNANSSNNSPSHLSARPSSAEAGTRPSTAGSDKIHDSAPNVWSSNLRPSSASGELSSNQTSPLSLRPRSAEPRPGSSQLSRFAEPSSDISVPGSGERLEVTSSKNDGFSLNTGDFPSLGSMKCSSGKNAGSQDPSFHDSGSTSGVPMTKEVSENYSVGDAALSTDAKHTSDGSWRRDNPLYGEDGLRVSMEKWDGDTPPYQNPGILPQHFNAWCGPPVNNPPGAVWYRGPPSGPPPYGEPIPPGGFPMEPFQYYHPQIPASALPNPQQVPPPGTGPRGPHPRNGDMYRPQMPDAYIRPGMPVRPGFFSRPVPYDGYFGHPMGYCRPNDRDLPSMGMAGGPPSIYGQFPSQNAHDAGNSHIRPPEHGSNNEPCNSQESGHHRDPEPYRVLLKPHDNWNEKSEEQKQEETKRRSGSMEKVDSSRASSWENDWRKDRRKDGDRDLKVGAVDEDASQNFDSRASRSLVPNKVKSPENLGSARVDRDYAGAGHNNFVAPGGPQSVAPKDSTLIEKIEGLNAKARASDLRPDFMFVSDRPEQGSMLPIQGTKSSLPAAGAGHHAPYPANVQVAQVLSTEEKVLEDAAISGPNTSRGYPYSGHGKAHHQWGKGRFNSEDDGFRKKPAVLDPLLPTPLETSYVQRPAHRSSQPRMKYEGGYLPVTSGPGDIQAERAKMKAQRVKQKREEEEERSREQKAKAQMKLEELNRRMQVVEGSNSKTESSILNKPQDLVPPVESKKIYGKSALSNPTPVSDGELLQQTMKNRNNTVGRSSNQTKEFQQEPPNDACKESVIIHNQSVPVQQHAEIAGDNSDVAPQIHSNVPSKQHWTGSKQKQSMAFEENTTQKIASEAPKLEANVADDVTTAVDAGADFSAHQRRRSNRGNRYKHKGDESSAANNLQSLAHKESGQVCVASVEGVKLKAETEQSVVGAVTKPTDVNHLLEQCPDSTYEEAHGRGSNQWKPQYSRRAPRHQQVKRVADKVHGGENAVWTPIRTHNATEIADENNERTAVKDQSLSLKSDQPLQNNNPRGKRAEIERYVPKPVAKEMAQQGSVQLVAALDSQNKMTDEAIQQVDTGSSSVAVKESRNADSRQNRSARGHGLWQQRCTTDNISVQGLHIEQSQSHFSQTSGNIRKQPEHNRRPKPEEQPSMEQIKDHDRGLSCGSVIFPTDSSILGCQPQFTAPAGRYQGTPGRGKRHPSFKAPQYDLDPDQKKSSDKLEISHNPSVAPEVSQTDPASAASVPRENHGILERATLHWQPKSRAVSGQNNQGNRAADDDRNTAGSSGLVTEKAPKEHDVTRDQSDFVKDKMHEEAGQFDNSKRERRPRSSAARHRSPGQVALKSEELANRQQEVGSSLGPRKSGNQSASQFMRADENRGVRNSTRQDTRQYNVPTHRERQRYNSSYRYQPVGPYNEDRSSHFEGVRDGSQSAGPRYQERAGQSGSRRDGGSFNERQVGNS